jgi:3-oxoadipate enol-lactonase
LSLDHRGHGRGLRPRRFELEQCAADAAAAARARGVDRLVAVGYSMGGPIASLLWHKHRGLVDGLVLCATAHELVPARVVRAARMLLPTVAALASWMPRRAHDILFGDLLRRVESSELRNHLEQEMSSHDPASVIQAVHRLATFSAHAWLRTIDVPTAVLVMTQDRLVPPARQYALAEAIPEAEIYEVEGNHLACIGKPELFVPTLLRACRDVQRRAGGAPRRARSDAK